MVFPRGPLGVGLHPRALSLTPQSHVPRSFRVRFFLYDSSYDGFTAKELIRKKESRCYITSFADNNTHKVVTTGKVTGGRGLCRLSALFSYII